MAFYKATCAKNNQKIELMVQFDSLEDARQNLHSQWYSIIEIKETSEFTNNSEIFYFDFLTDWKIKKGSINSDDILKAYIKLVDDLHHNIIFLYENKEATENEKILTTQKIKHSYDIYKSRVKESPNIQAPIKKENHWEENNINSILLKELNHYYLLIDKVLEKINFIINNFGENITIERKVKLNDLYNSLKQVKNITNISKLKLIGETALLKIGEFQMELISQNIMEWKKEILWDTNKLLKWFWSTKQINLPEDDIKLKINNLYKDILFYIKNLTIFTLKKEKIDRSSWKYFNILRELETYKIKLKEINFEILKNFFNKEKKLRLVLKKKFILQNINLITKRIKNKKISYTKTIKWFNYYKDIIIFLIQKLWDLVVYSLFIYTIFFIGLNSYEKLFSQKIDINYRFILYIVIISLFWFLLKISKNFTILVISLIIYILSFIYLIVNF